MAKKIFFLLTLAGGIFILYPYANYQPWIATGDHGRDFYCFQAVGKGLLPYRDFWWVYGPLMLYYYNLFFQLLGLKMSSILIGKILLDIASGVFVYLSVSTVLFPLAGLLAALWFFTFMPDFFYTYNHAGGVTLLMAIIYCLCRYIKNPNKIYLVISLLFLFVLSFVKINIGLFSLVAFVLSIALIHFLNRNSLSKKFYGIALTGLPLAVLAVYVVLAQGLSIYEIRQCFPYIGEDQPHNISLGNALKTTWQLFVRQISFSWATAAFALLLFLCAAKTFYFIVKEKKDLTLRNDLLALVVTLVLFYLFNAPEHLKSGVTYRIYWSKPFSMMLVMVFILFAVRDMPRLVRRLLYGILFFLMISAGLERQAVIQKVKQPKHFLNVERGGIFANNDPSWFQAVEETTRYLSSHLKGDETFLTLPYDPLYYYLANKTSPSRQLILFEHIKIPTEQEYKIIEEIEKRRTDYIVLSSRAYAKERGLGILGKDYCPALGKYIEEHFDGVASFGEWDKEPGWAWNHGTRILKRRK